MKRFALMTCTFPWVSQQVIMEHTCNTKLEAVEYFRKWYPSQQLDDDGYGKSGNVTWTVAEFFQNSKYPLTIPKQ